MKTILTALLFCLLLESILSTKMSLNMKKDNSIKLIKDIKEKNLRKLESTELITFSDYTFDTVEEFSSSSEVQTFQTEEKDGKNDSNYDTTKSTIDEYNSPPAEDYTDDPFSNQTENINATAKDSFVSSNKPVSQKGYKTDNKRANIHFMKFHSFSKEKDQGKIKFKTIFYFINKAIPYSIIYRLRIKYNSIIRNLQAEM